MFLQINSFVSPYEIWYCFCKRSIYTFVKELGKSSGLVKQLLRDFYYNLVYHFPKLLQEGWFKRYL